MKVVFGKVMPHYYWNGQKEVLDSYDFSICEQFDEVDAYGENEIEVIGRAWRFRNSKRWYVAEEVGSPVDFRNLLGIKDDLTSFTDADEVKQALRDAFQDAGHEVV